VRDHACHFTGPRRDEALVVATRRIPAALRDIGMLHETSRLRTAYLIVLRELGGGDGYIFDVVFASCGVLAASASGVDYLSDRVAPFATVQADWYYRERRIRIATCNHPIAYANSARAANRIITTDWSAV
jgi:hypothetical protein